MNKFVETGSFSMEKASAHTGRFERAVDGQAGRALLSAQFGGRLRRMFDMPAGDEGVQDQFDALLRQIGDKLG